MLHSFFTFPDLLSAHETKAPFVTFFHTLWPFLVIFYLTAACVTLLPEYMPKRLQFHIPRMLLKAGYAANLVLSLLTLIYIVFYSNLMQQMKGLIDSLNFRWMFLLAIVLLWEPRKPAHKRMYTGIVAGFILYTLYLLLHHIGEMIAAVSR